MGKVIYDISMSLDGFITGADPFPEEGWGGLGTGGKQLHDWAFESKDPRNQQIMEKFPEMGAVIVGRTTYDLSIPNWGSGGPIDATRVPTIIVSHSVPKEMPPNHVYTFVTGVDEAFETAKKLAGDKGILTMGGNVAQQLLRRGLIDEISIHLVPVLFGSGTRLFEGLEGDHISLEPVEVIDTADVTHLRYRVIK